MPSDLTLTDLGSDSTIELMQDNDSSFNLSKFINVLVLAVCVTFMLVLYLPTYYRSWKTLNLNGKLIAVHLYSVLVWYALIFIGLLISFNYRSGKKKLVTREGLGAGEVPKKRIGSLCDTLAVFSHYFYLARYLCLCTLSNGAFSKSSAMGYWPYGVFSWILPLLAIILFCVADFLAQNPCVNDIVPDYGVESCNVASWSAGYYVHIPIAIILVANLVNIVLRIIKARNNRDDVEEDENTLIKLHTCVSFVSTISWLLTFFDWILAYYEYEENFGMLLLIIAAIWETLLLCYMYCLSENVMGIMTSKLSCTKGVVNFLRGYGLIQKGDGLTGKFLKVTVGNAIEMGESNEWNNRNQ